MRKTLKVLSALLSYPTEDLKEAIPDMRTALDEDNLLPVNKRNQLDRLLDEITTHNIFDLQERYVLLFDRTRSLSLQLFEHVHGESRDRGQAMVDLQQLYEKNGLHVATTELPDYLPLFLEFLSTRPHTEACSLLDETVHILEAIRRRLTKRKTPYASIFSCLQVVATSKAQPETVEALMMAPDPEPDDLEALDAAWEEEQVKFGPEADLCGKSDLTSKLRSATRPAPGIVQPAPQRTVFTHKTSTRPTGG